MRCGIVGTVDNVDCDCVVCSQTIGAMANDVAIGKDVVSNAARRAESNKTKTIVLMLVMENCRQEAEDGYE